MSVNYTFNGNNVVDMGDFFLVGQNYLVAKTDIETLDAQDGSADGNVNLTAVEDLGAFADSYYINANLASQANVGDVDGDGLDDFVLARREFNDDNDDPHNPATFDFKGTGFLVTTSSLENLDNVDGLDDNIITEDNLLSASGNYQITGSNTRDSLFVQNSHSEALATGMDATGDGLDDLLVGAPEGDKSYLISSADYADIDAADGTIDQKIASANIKLGEGSYQFNGIGGANANFADIDGDGLADLLLQDGGNIKIISSADLDTFDALDGATDGVIQASNVDGDFESSFGTPTEGDNSYNINIGGDVASLGDITGDGLDDFAIRAGGTSYIIDASDLPNLDAAGGDTDGFIDRDDIAGISNITDGSSYEFVNSPVLSRADVSNAGDVDGDGVNDILFGNGQTNSTNPNNDEAMVIFSSDLASLDALDGTVDNTIDWSNIEDNGGYRFEGSGATGQSVDTAGDVDGDGLGDFFVTSGSDTHLLLGKDLEAHDLDDGNDDGVINLDTAIGGPICFVRGTRIKTRRGEIAIEDLAPGDMVLTVDHAYRPIRWIGSTSRLAFGKHAPVRIAQGTLGADRDLWVSQQHRIHVSSHQAELYFGENEVLASCSTPMKSSGPMA
jgi:hypothetical protein